MRTATEYIIDIRYCLRCLGVRVDCPTLLFGDNNGVILNATIEESKLKKKHVAIAYHMVREAVAAGIIQPVKLNGLENYADAFTKGLPHARFAYLVSGILFGSTP